MSLSLIYVTTGTREEAVKIGRAVVESRLAACANVLAPMTSMYWWQGAVNEADEVPLILKTQDSLVEQVIEKVKAIHSYDCPCVVALPISGGNQAFLDWIEAETAPKQQP